VTSSKNNNNKQWRLKKIKSVRVSPELLEMLEREIAARKTSFSKYVRHAAILQMKYGNKPTQQKEAA
jgi:hypothetical protein